MRKSFRVTIQDEIDLIILSFLSHFFWELMQTPFFASLDSVTHWEGVMICLKATFGDVSIALVAFWITSVVAKSRRWIHSTSITQLFVFLLVGLVFTVGLEHYNTEIAFNWSYSDQMPLVPPFGTGLIPLIQWLVIPVFVLWFIRRRNANTV